MKNRDAICGALDLIEENLKREMTVEEIATKFNFSLFYFSRLFKGITGYSPKEYLLKRKLSEAARDIVATRKRIIDIAFEYGFGTPESFSRAFMRLFGVNPSEFRKTKSLDAGRLFSLMSIHEVKRKRANRTANPVIVKLGPVHLIGLQFYCDMDNTKDLSAQWDLLMSNIHRIENRIQPEKYYQVQYWFPDQDTRRSIFFFLAAETKNLDAIPMQFTGKILPELYYVKFIHKGLARDVGNTYRFIYEEWLPETEYRLPYLFNFEYYGDACTGPYDEESESEIYIPVDRRD